MEESKGNSSIFKVCKVYSPGWQKDKEGTRIKGCCEITVTVFSKMLKMLQLITLIKLWEDEYEQYNQFENGIRYFVFKPAQADKNCYRSKPMKYYTEFSFESSKTIDNIYFPEKVMKKIKFFRDNPLLGTRSVASPTCSVSCSTTTPDVAKHLPTRPSRPSPPAHCLHSSEERPQHC